MLAHATGHTEAMQSFIFSSINSDPEFNWRHESRNSSRTIKLAQTVDPYRVTLRAFGQCVALELASPRHFEWESHAPNFPHLFFWTTFICKFLRKLHSASPSPQLKIQFLACLPKPIFSQNQKPQFFRKAKVFQKAQFFRKAQFFQRPIFFKSPIFSKAHFFSKSQFLKAQFFPWAQFLF